MIEWRKFPRKTAQIHNNDQKDAIIEVVQQSIKGQFVNKKLAKKQIVEYLI